MRKVHHYDYMAEKWIDDPTEKVERQAPPKPKRPTFSLVEWFIIGPMVVGLSFMAAVMWP